VEIATTRTADAAAVVRTVGHGTRTTNALATLLRAAAVSTLIDVRRYPMGRRQPHLSRGRLAVDLPALGIAYEWWGETLGGRRQESGVPLDPSPWRSPAFAAYARYMTTAAFQTALAAVEARARTGEALAIMCAETLWWRCHRRLIADTLVLDGFEVRHLLDRPPGSLHQASSPGRATEH
jgi:uncharacterized protein (DUF488 family)